MALVKLDSEGGAVMEEAGYSFANELRRYAVTEAVGKADYILNNYRGLKKTLNSYEHIWKTVIVAEKRHNALAEKGETGVRIQTSGSNDPTAAQALSNIEIEKAISGNEIRNVVQGTDDPEQHILERMMIFDMNDDLQIMNDAIQMLGDENEKLFMAYIRSEKTIGEMASDMNVQYDTARARICKMRKFVMKRASSNIEIKYRLIEGRTG